MESTSSGFSEFLQTHRTEILAEWEQAVRRMPVARDLSTQALLDHVPHLLERISQIAEEIASGGVADVPQRDADLHASARLDEGFDLPQVVEEFSALRSCILRKWSHEHRGHTGLAAIETLNSAIDRAVSASVERYTQASDRTLRALDRISIAAFESRDIEELLARLLQAFMETTAAVDTAVIMLRDGDRLVTRAAVGLEEEVAAGFSLKIGEGFAGRAALEKRPAFLRNASKDPIVRSSFLRARGVRALYAIPLIAGDDVIGVAKMGSLTADEFSQQDRRLFGVLGARATAAIYQRLLQETADARAAENKRSRDQLRVILQGVSEGIVAVDRNQKLLFANDEAVRTSGFPSFDEMAAAAPAALKHELRGEDGGLLANDERPITRAFATREIVRQVVRSRLLSGGDEQWWNVTATPVPSGNGEVQMAIAIWHDITGKQQDEQREKFLADATALLSQSLDLEETLRKVASLSVPAIADWCVVDRVVDEKDARRVAVVHADPKKAAWANELQKRYPPDWDAPRGVGQVLRTGQSEIYPDIPDEALVSVARDAEHLRLLRELGMKSAICVPMISRGKIIGALTFITDQARRRYHSADLILAEELARRAAIAVDNAGLFAEAQTANRKKDEFLAMLAHELRNPLGPIMNAAALLKTGIASDRPVEVIDRQVRHMARMVDDLLEVSRISRGKIDLKREMLDLVDVAREVSSDCSDGARRAGLSVSLETPSEPVRVFGDRTRLAQAVTNLVGNAIKFSEPGGHIVLRVSVAGTEARIAVKDEGIGIDAETLGSLFEAFTQGDRTLDRSRGGLGLGLAIVRGLVELHGGRVVAHSGGPRHGAEFTISLPLARSPASANLTKPAETPAVAPLTILLVEDNRDAAEMLSALLEHDGHRVSVCYSGEHGLEEARRLRPDVILCDLGLPRKDGFSVARELRRDPATSRSKLIAISGYGTEADRQRAREAGFDAHLTKPVDPATLRSIFSAQLAKG